MKMAASRFVIFLFITVFHALLWESLATDTLRQGQQLAGFNRLESAKGMFSLGFFPLTADGRNNYLGIWYTNDPASGRDDPIKSDKVWVANRNDPLPEDSGILILDDAGNLKINYTGGKQFIIYSSGETSSSIQFKTKAVLEDKGNFVLKPDNGSDIILWQSFDHPTNTLLPGMKLGINNRTKQKWVLTSWITDNSLPANGSFTLEWEPKERSLVIKYRGQPRWSSGPFNGTNDWFGSIKLDDDYHYGYNIVSNNAGEDYFSYTIENNIEVPSRWVLSSSGTINTDYNTLADADSCYGYNTDYGCLKWLLRSCRIKDEHFIRAFGSFNFGNDGLDASSSLSDCREACWNDCDCIGFSTITSFQTECSFYHRGQHFIRSNSTYDGPHDFLYIQQKKAEESPPAPAPAPATVHSPIQKRLAPPSARVKVKKWIWMSIAIAVALVTLVTGIVCYTQRRKRKTTEIKVEEKILLKLMSNSDGIASLSDEKGLDDLQVYPFSGIVAATNNFSVENKLGQGGFGEVYKGILAEGIEVAVKRLSTTSRQGVLEFKNELVLIAKLQHTNLVRLLGCCMHEEEKMLIYEYMPNNSLDYLLFDSTRGQVLNWEIRFHIIEGIAQGLLYLHKYSRLKVIHRDLKASNILLDGSMNPKISDFGMARIFSQNRLEANTIRVVGTYGYMSPEYAMKGIFSDKSDVFSFGVLLLEILSGKRNNHLYNEDHPLNLVGYAWELWKRGEATELMDQTLRESCPSNQFIRCVNVGLLCVEDKPSDRPSILKVMSMLTNETSTLPRPKNPGFFIRRVIGEGSSETNKASECASINDLTISVTQGR